MTTKVEYNNYFTLGDLIETLSQYPPEQVCSIGFTNPHSYRGIYEDLAFEPKKNQSVGEMLRLAEASVGIEFQGYKGGWFTMGKHTECWVAYSGSSGGDKIGPIMLHYMLGDADELDFYEVEETFKVQDGKKVY